MLKSSLRTLMKESDPPVKKEGPKVKKEVPQVKKERPANLFDDFKENIREIRNTNYNLPSKLGRVPVEVIEKPVVRSRPESRDGENLLLDKLSRQNQAMEAMAAQIRQLQVEKRQLGDVNRQLTDEKRQLTNEKQQLKDENLRCKQKIAAMEDRLGVDREPEDPLRPEYEKMRRALEQEYDKRRHLAEQVQKYHQMVESEQQQRLRDADTIKQLQTRLTHHKHTEEETATRLAATKAVNEVLRQLLDQARGHNLHDDNTTDLLLPQTDNQYDDDSTTQWLLRQRPLAGIARLRVAVHMINFIHRLQRAQRGANWAGARN